MRGPESHLATVVVKRRFGDTEQVSRCLQETTYSGQVFVASLCCPHGTKVSLTMTPDATRH